MPELKVNVPAIEKLLDYTAIGVGAVAGPILRPWREFWEEKAKRISARADAEVRRIQAESEAETSAIIAKARSEAAEYLLAPDAEVRGTVEFTRDDIIQRVEYQERKRLANVRSVVEDTAENLGDKEVADHEPDPDWTARFFDSVQDVSSEEMRKIWAKILAGEVESPGRTSLRTLDTLRNMTKRDAQMFLNICDFVLGGGFLFYDDSVKEFDALNYSNLLHLQDCGLVNVGPSLVKIFRWVDDREIFLLDQRSGLTISRSQGAPETLKIPDVLLTTAGKELFQFVDCKWHTEYLQALSTFLGSKNCQLHLLGGFERLPDGRFIYAARVPIGPKPSQAEPSTP